MRFYKRYALLWITSPIYVFKNIFFLYWLIFPFEIGAHYTPHIIRKATNKRSYSCISLIKHNSSYNIAFHTDQALFIYPQYLNSTFEFKFSLDNEFYFEQGVLEFWLQKGVDGFRADALKFMFESPNVTEDETGLTVTRDSPSPKFSNHSTQSSTQIFKEKVHKFNVKTQTWCWILTWSLVTVGPDDVTSTIMSILHWKSNSTITSTLHLHTYR